MFKNEVLGEQKKAALPYDTLTQALEELKKAGEERDNEKSKRWQNHYDYITARLMLQIAYLVEYQSLVGGIRKDLPERDAAIHNGWRVISQEKMVGDKIGKDMAKDAKKILDKLADKNPGTPWEVLAKQDRLTRLGLNWQASKLP
jgi:hypothetical protein